MYRDGSCSDCRALTCGDCGKHGPLTWPLYAPPERGWICPHQATPLGSIEPVDGIIICPLHGLRIDAQTGIVVPSVSAAGKEGE